MMFRKKLIKLDTISSTNCWRIISVFIDDMVVFFIFLVNFVDIVLLQHAQKKSKACMLIFLISVTFHNYSII